MNQVLDLQKLPTTIQEVSMPAASSSSYALTCACDNGPGRP